MRPPMPAKIAMESAQRSGCHVSAAAANSAEYNSPQSTKLLHPLLQLLHKGLDMELTSSSGTSKKHSSSTGNRSDRMWTDLCIRDTCPAGRSHSMPADQTSQQIGRGPGPSTERCRLPCKQTHIATAQLIIPALPLASDPVEQGTLVLPGLPLFGSSEKKVPEAIAYSEEAEWMSLAQIQLEQRQRLPNDRASASHHDLTADSRLLASPRQRSEGGCRCGILASCTGGMDTASDAYWFAFNAIMLCSMKGLLACSKAVHEFMPLLPSGGVHSTVPKEGMRLHTSHGSVAAVTIIQQPSSTPVWMSDYPFFQLMDPQLPHERPKAVHESRNRGEALQISLLHQSFQDPAQSLHCSLALPA